MKVVDVRATLGPVFRLKIKPRMYECSECGTRTRIETNHTYKCFTKCHMCKGRFEFVYVGPVPSDEELNTRMQDLLTRHGHSTSWDGLLVIGGDDESG